MWRGPAQLAGRVRASDGRPLGGARVSIVGSDVTATSMSRTGRDTRVALTPRRVASTARTDSYETIRSASLVRSMNAVTPAPPKPAIADGKGQFSFNNVSVGERTLLYTSPDIDSLGFGALDATVKVQSREASSVYISTPSLRTLWDRLCVGAAPLSADSGIVWGTIRDAANLQPRPNAYAEFRWYDLDSTLVRGLLIHDTRKEVVTGNTGLFFACGVPTGVAINSEAIDSSAASGLLQYSLGDHRLLRLDLLVSRDMIVADSTKLSTSADGVASMRAHGLRRASR